MPTDTERLDWMERTQTPVYRCTVEKRGYRSTLPDAQREVWHEFTGWACSIAAPEQPTIREAIDAAMNAQTVPAGDA